MRIALDAKRAFHNATGLGNYSRNLIDGFTNVNQANDYFLFTPKIKNPIYLQQLPENFHIVQNTSLIKPYWRSFSIASDLVKKEVQVYHGLSNELPFTLEGSDIKKVVTIHDLLYLRFPHLYPILDRNIYFHKAKKSCAIADIIIATSKATKLDIIEKLKVPEEKVKVVYQSCNDDFFKPKSEDEFTIVKDKYELPSEYFLCVGRLEERKNIRQVMNAVARLKKEDQLPLLVVGKGKKYYKTLRDLAQSLEIDVHFEYRISNEELPTIVQHARIFYYVSFYEGFGIPVLEAMASKVPIITSKDTSMSEIIADKNCLVNPYSLEEITDKTKELLTNNNADMIAANHKKALSFTNKNFAKETLDIYHSLLS